MGQSGIIEGKPITLSQRIELVLKSTHKPFTPQDLFETYFENLSHKIHPDAIVFISKEKIQFSTWIFFEIGEISFLPEALYGEKVQKVTVVKGQISDELYAVSDCQKAENYYLVTSLPVSTFEEIEEEKTLSGKARV